MRHEDWPSVAQKVAAIISKFFVLFCDHGQRHRKGATHRRDFRAQLFINDFKTDGDAIVTLFAALQMQNSTTLVDFDNKLKATASLYKHCARI